MTFYHTIIRPQTLDLLVLKPATDYFWRSLGDGKMKKSKVVLLFFSSLGRVHFPAIGRKSVPKDQLPKVKIIKNVPFTSPKVGVANWRKQLQSKTKFKL